MPRSCGHRIALEDNQRYFVAAIQQPMIEQRTNIAGKMVLPRRIELRTSPLPINGQ